MKEPAMVACPMCGALVKRTGGRVQVHYPSITDTRPCPQSWKSLTPHNGKEPA